MQKYCVKLSYPQSAKLSRKALSSVKHIMLHVAGIKCHNQHDHHSLSLA